MRFVIAGSRHIPESEALSKIQQFMNDNPDVRSKIEEVVSGGCRGVDAAAMKYAQNNNIHYEEFPAKWDVFGPSAGPRRNKHMAMYGDALLLIWDGQSKGSASMKFEMQRLRKKFWEIICA